MNWEFTHAPCVCATNLAIHFAQFHWYIYLNCSFGVVSFRVSLLFLKPEKIHVMNFCFYGCWRCTFPTPPTKDNLNPSKEVTNMKDSWWKLLLPHTEEICNDETNERANKAVQAHLCSLFVKLFNAHFCGKYNFGWSVCMKLCNIVSGDFRRVNECQSKVYWSWRGG